MPVLPKSLFVLGASLQTARMARRLKRGRDDAASSQNIAFKNLVGKLAATAAGRESGIAAGMDYEKFRARVPVRNYEHFRPYIDRMKRGETGVLWPGACSLYALSAGTTSGESRALPVTAEMLAHFRAAAAASLLFYSARVGHSGVFRGRHLLLGGCAALHPLNPAKPAAGFAGNLVGIVTLDLPPAVERHLHEPDAAVSKIAEWPRRLEAIVSRTRSLDLTLLAGTPDSLLLLADAVRGTPPRAGHPPAALAITWPNLECILHTGVPIAPFQDELRHAVGPNVNFHEVLQSTEGFIAAQDAEPDDGLRLLANSGLFFEFLPLREFDPALPPGTGTRCVPLQNVRVGEDYVLVLTTPAGLSRYVLGDVVRFVGTQPHRLLYIGRSDLRLNAFGEHTSEKDLADTLVAVCRRHDWTIKNFHVAPLFATSLTGSNRGRHEWWIELKAGTSETPTGPILAPALDRELEERNPGYAAKRRAGAIEAPFVRLVMPGFFAHWKRHRGKADAQHKMPRCRSDRLIADELSAMACFNAD